MENKLVSIIIPVYNVEKYIKKCLDTVLCQSHHNLEIILVDDGSSDASGIICDEYAQKDKRVKVIHKENEGVSVARNTGIDIATGEYICFSDADDYLQLDYVEYLLKIANENDADIAVTTDWFITFLGKEFPEDLRDIPLVLSPEHAAAAILYYHIPIGCNSKIFKRSLLNNKIRFYPQLSVGEGFNFNVKAFLSANKVVVTKRRIYYYRRNNPASCMTKFKLEKCSTALYAIQMIKDNLMIKSNSLNNACDFADWHTHGDMYNWMVLAKVKDMYPDMYMRCFNKVRSYSFKAIFAPISKKEKFRAILQFIHPRLLAFVLELRRAYYQR